MSKKGVDKRKMEIRRRVVKYSSRMKAEKGADRFFAVTFAVLMFLMMAYAYASRFHSENGTIRLGRVPIHIYDLGTGICGLLGVGLLLRLFWRGAKRKKHDLLALAVTILGFGLFLLISEEISIGDQAGALATMGEVLIATLLGVVANAIFEDAKPSRRHGWRPPQKKEP